MNIVNSYRYKEQLTPTIYDNATFIHSLRELTTNSSNCIRVERTSDNTQTDIGFVGGFLDTVSLLSFVGASDGIVVRWYNQGSVGGYMEATTGNTIVKSGVLNTLNSLACIDFVGGNITSNRITGYFNNIDIPANRGQHGYADTFTEVFVGLTTNGDRVIRGFTSGGRLHFIDQRSFRHNLTTAIFTVTELHNQQVILGSCWSLSNTTIRFDQQGVNIGTNNTLNGNWGSNGLTYGWDPMKLQEHVIWDFNAEDTSTTLLGDFCDTSNNYWSAY